MSNKSNDILPEHVRGLPIDTQVAVLYERVSTLQMEVRGLKKSLWAFVFSILGGALLFMLTIAAGWIGQHGGGTTHALSSLVGW